MGLKNRGKQLEGGAKRWGGGGETTHLGNSLQCPFGIGDGKGALGDDSAEPLSRSVEGGENRLDTRERLKALEKLK